MRHVRLALLTALVLLAAACTGGDDDTPTSSPTTEVTPSPSASPTATAAPTETATPTSTPTPAPTTIPTPVPTAGQLFGVVNVHRNDPDGGLNLRAEASAASDVLAVIPFNATDVVATGDSVGDDSTTWYRVTQGGTTGWVNANYLSPLPGFDEISCGDTATEYTFGGAVPQGPADTDPAADSVFALHQYDGPDCQRTVITFGRDFNFDDALAGTLQTAAGVPENVAVALDAASVEVTLPESVIAAAPTATESFARDNGLADLLFVRPTTAPQFDVVALWDRNRGARVFSLPNPGRLIIDTIDAPTGTGLNLAPVVSDDPAALTVLTHPINVDVNGPAPTPPIVVSGFSRPFEATLAIVLRTAPAEGASPGSGNPVNADWSGSSFADSCGSQYSVMTTDYTEAWGAFEFTIEALAPGTYELFVGEFSARDGSEVGVYHVFTVGGDTAASC